MTNIKEVASIAGVSISTVSRVLNGRNVVNEETRKKVLEAVQKTNYQPNLVAQNLKMGRSNTICMMVPSIANPIFSEIVKGFEDTAQRNGFIVVLCNTDEDPKREIDYLEKMKARWIDGFVVCSKIGEAKYINDLREEGYPLVLINRYEETDIGVIDTVSVDNFRSAYDAVKYLIRTGHKRIGFAQGREQLYLYRERYRGYCQALLDHGMEVDQSLIMYESYGTDCFYHMTKTLMSRPEPPDAIFASSDPKAFVIMHALHDMGLRIPEDVSVLGFDNVNLASMMEPPLSGVSQPLYEMGTVAAQSLIYQISYKETHGELPAPVRNLLRSDLVIRRSTK